MKTMPYPVRIPKHLLELADLRAMEEQIDRSTALRQLLHVGAVTYVLDVLAKGRISLSKAAELLDATPLAIVEKAREHGVELGAHVDAYRAAKALERPAPHRVGKRRPRSTTRPGSSTRQGPSRARR
jgi:predicted HTH domain antitoxin